MRLRYAYIHCNPAGNLESWICSRADPRQADEEGEIILCPECSDALRSGAILVDEETKARFPKSLG
jgi:hypothetical protein